MNPWEIPSIVFKSERWLVKKYSSEDHVVVWECSSYPDFFLEITILKSPWEKLLWSLEKIPKNLNSKIFCSCPRKKIYIPWVILSGSEFVLEITILKSPSKKLILGKNSKKISVKVWKKKSILNFFLHVLEMHVYILWVLWKNA